MSNVNSFSGAYLILKESCAFLWHNKRMVPAISFFKCFPFVFSLFFVRFIKFFLPIERIVAFLSKETWARLFEPFSFIGFLFKGIPAEDFIVAYFLMGIVVMPLIFLGWFLISAYSSITGASYVLSALSAQPMTFIQSLVQGSKKLLRAWRVLLGTVLVVALLIACGFLILKLISIRALWPKFLVAAIILFYLMLLVLFLVRFYFWQSIAEGHYSFRGAVKQSWHCYKKSWLCLLAFAIYTFFGIIMVSGTLSVPFGIISLLPEDWGIVVVWAGPIISLLFVASIWSVAINKTYLVAQEEK